MNFEQNSKYFYELVDIGLKTFFLMLKKLPVCIFGSIKQGILYDLKKYPLKSTFVFFLKMLKMISVQSCIDSQQITTYIKCLKYF